MLYEYRFSFSLQVSAVGIVTIRTATLQKRPQAETIPYIVQCHRAGKWQSKDLSPDLTVSSSWVPDDCAL